MALSTYTEPIGQRIAEELMSGNSLVQICNEPGMPNRVTVIRWMDRYPEFATLIERARTLSADAIADRIQAITDQVLAGSITPEQGRVASANLMWFCGKLNQGRYGDKLALSGNAGLTINIVRGDTQALPGSNEPKAIDAEFTEVD